jgi:addiction module RelE/StbE family toxin
MRIRWTSAALDDLKAISLRIERECNLATANRVCRAIYDTVQLLRRHPQSGRPGSEEGTRELVVAKLPYIIAYRLVRSEAVQVLRIWHGAQDRH